MTSGILDFGGGGGHLERLHQLQKEDRSTYYYGSIGIKD